jgi:RimJ/RimL family protein N-acetyltransferase
MAAASDPVLPRPRPARVVLAGRYARLEPLSSAHAAGLYEASSGEGAAQRFAYLPAHPPSGNADIQAWIGEVSKAEDRLYCAVVDPASGTALGRQSLMRIDPANGVIEIGDILWGPRMARMRIATEALYLAARYVFDDLGYRRFEWKCNDLNEPSKTAARRFGFVFEGVFRQHMWLKGANRDTAWFAMLDRNWPRLRAEYQRWLDPANFDAQGIQRSRLSVSTG